MLCILCFVSVIICYSLFVIYLFVLIVFVVVHLFCSLFDFPFPRFCLSYSSSILLFSSFFVHCSKEKSFNSILILDCVPGISIPLFLFKYTIIYASQ
jgi:hypothetical protein